MPDIIEITRAEGRINLKLNAFLLGEDLCIIVTGGDKPHLGAVTVGSKQVEAWTFCFPHHKEDEVTKLLYAVITETFDKNVMICCGIHIDNISASEIDTVVSLCREMIIELKSKINI
jgi:hypothetical protein